MPTLFIIIVRLMLAVLGKPFTFAQWVRTKAEPTI